MVGDEDADGAITPSNIKSLSNGVCFATLPRRGSVTPPLLLRVPYAPVWVKTLFAEHNADTHDAVADYMESLDLEGAQ
jgi:rhamnose utilization protein RhaD (predicted bifunctional aldolase and dehydrogenase)